MKLTKENIYINLQGKSEDELKDLYEFLISNNEDVYIGFSDLRNNNYWKRLEFWKNTWTLSISKENKTEVKIQELKQILKPMETFTPIAMKCTQEQFEAIKPKLNNCRIGALSLFENFPYLVNNADNEPLKVYNLNSRKDYYDRTIHEEWNEEIFLKACGIEVDNLEQQLQKAEAEVKRLQSLIEEKNKPKIGDWVKSKISDTFFKFTSIDRLNDNYVKITNPELIKLLEQEIK